jgi:hypothetical protein
MMKINIFLILFCFIFLLTGCQPVDKQLLKSESTNNKLKKYIKYDGTHEIKKASNGVIVYKDNTLTNTTVLPDFAIKSESSSPNFDFGPGVVKFGPDNE